MLTCYERDGVYVVQPQGRLDHGVSTGFDRDLSAETDTAIDLANHLVIDLGNVTFLSSIILKVIRSQKDRLAERGLRVALCNPTPVVREILSIAKFDFVAELHETVEDASASLGQA